MGDKILEVNLEELFVKYTWGCYKRNKGCFEKLFLRKSDHLFDIRWEYVDFKHETNPGKQKRDQSTVEDKDDSKDVSADKDISDIDGQVKDAVPKCDDIFKRDVELYISEFKNSTGGPQKYVFSASRDTTSLTRFELQEGYSLGMKTNLEISFKDIAKIGGEVSENFSLNKIHAEEFKKTLTWNVNTEIEVPAMNIAKASFYVYEIPTKSKFVVKTTLSLPTSRIPIIVSRRRNGKKVHTQWITNLACLFDDDYKKNSSVEFVPRTVKTETGREVLDTTVVLTSSGICKSVSYTNQQVSVECKPIEGMQKYNNKVGDQKKSDSNLESVNEGGVESKDLYTRPCSGEAETKM